MAAVKIGDIVRVRLGPDAESLFRDAFEGKLFKVQMGWPGEDSSNIYFYLHYYPGGGPVIIDGEAWEWIHVSNLEPITKFEARTYEIIHGTENA